MLYQLGFIEWNNIWGISWSQGNRYRGIILTHVRRQKERSGDVAVTETLGTAWSCSTWARRAKGIICNGGAATRKLCSNERFRLWDSKLEDFKAMGVYVAQMLVTVQVRGVHTIGKMLLDRDSVLGKAIF